MHRIEVHTANYFNTGLLRAKRKASEFSGKSGYLDKGSNTFILNMVLKF